MSEEIRLNKFLAACGVGSRRSCDALIESGRVEVNGQPCLALGTRVSDADAVRVDGKRVRRKTSVVLVLHKPRGLVCSRSDELGRETIYSLLPARFAGLHHVGRLDRDSEGLLVMTNDGDLTQRLMHPSRGVEKEYLVTADQAFQAEHLDQFLSGVHTPEGKLRAKALERLSPRRLKVVLDQGAKRQIRVMFEALGYRVVKLLRVRIGGLWLGDLEVGGHAILQGPEIAMLLAEDSAGPKGKKRKTKPAGSARKSTRAPQARQTKPAGPAKKAARPPQARKTAARKTAPRKEGPAGRSRSGPSPRSRTKQ